MAKSKAAVVFIHGLARKPEPGKLREIWTWALGTHNPQPTVFGLPNPGIHLATEGHNEFHNYWADVFYGEEYETDLASYYESDSGDEILQSEGFYDADPSVKQLDIQTPRERRFIEQIERKLKSRLPPTEEAIEAAPDEDVREIARLLPKPVRNAIIERFAKEAYYFLFDKAFTREDGTVFQVRKELRTRLLRNLHAAAAESDSITIVCHSMGTMIAYDVLRNCEDCPAVDTLITLGSPLGIAEVQDELIHASRSSVDFPAKKLLRWINIYDPLDPICGADPELANDYDEIDGKSIRDIREDNWGSWRHTITHYLQGRKFRNILAQEIRLQR